MSADREINKPFIPRICLRCEQRGTFVVLEDRIECQHCGYALRKEDGQPIKAVDMQPKKPKVKPNSDDPRNKLRASTMITHPGPVDKWARAAFMTAQDYIRRQQWADAERALLRSIESQADFIDGHLWLARVLEDPAQKRQHLEKVIAHQPNHMEAIRELMILDGKLSADAVGMNDAHIESEQREVGAAVGTETKNLRCPTCGSPDMLEHDGVITCQSCGHTDTTKQRNTQVGTGMLTAALLERRSQPVTWIVGERLLDCNSCGAKRTIPARKLSDRCPFCGSNHVIQRDVLDTFTQPDGLVPFVVSKQQAADAIKRRLKGWDQRVKGWFGNNSVARATLDGIYLPFWVFDATLQVRRTVHRDYDYSQDSRSRNFLAGSLPAYDTMTIPDAINNVPICAVKSPAPYMTRNLGQYDFSAAIAYAPDLLAKFPAELYSIDFDKASLMAREPIGAAMREKHLTLNPAGSGEQVNISTSVMQMHFRLLLAPVWVATLYEEDGDVRTTLVNGQNGQVVLGRAQKPK